MMVMKRIAQLSVLTSLIGASIISVNLGFFQLSIFRIMILIISIIILIQMFKNDERFRLRSNNDISYSIKFFLFWFLYALISLAWVKDYGAWVRAVYFIGLGFLTIIIFSRLFKKTADIIIAFKLLAIMSIFHNLIGWYEISTGNYMFLSTDLITEYYEYKYPVSMFGNTNDYATFMLFSVFIAYICFSNSRNIIGKLIYIIIMISSTYLLLMTSSRSNILGLILGITAFVYFSLRKSGRRNVIVFILISLFGVVLLAPQVLDSIVLKVNHDFLSNLTSDTDSDIVRSNLIKNGFVFLINTIGFGTGAGNVEYWMANYGTYFTDGILNIHNWWMEILTGYGVYIFILYIIFYLKLFRSIYMTYRTSKDKQTISISLGIMCYMIGFLLGSISSSSNISTEWLWVIWSITITFQGINSYRTLK